MTGVEDNHCGRTMDDSPKAAAAAAVKLTKTELVLG
jgi:hypothetical protein